MINKNQIECFLLASFIGDALGYPIEFYTLEKIQEMYGIVDDYIELPMHNFKKGLFSDDTQMSIATIQGIIKSDISNKENIVENIISEYKEWFFSQTERKNKRSPGMTCLDSLRYIIDNKIDKPSYSLKINNSKGNGALMRVAPICFLNFSLEDLIQIAYDISYITHCHPLGYYTSGFHVGVLKLILEGTELDSSIKYMINLFKNINNTEINNKLIPLIEKAIELSKNSSSDTDNIEKLGQGWVAEETLAIAIYCSLKYQNNLNQGIIASINHSGDSDSTGIVTGNILGLLNSKEDIPSNWIKKLEKKAYIQNLGKTLYEKINI